MRLFATRDGGETWREIDPALLPAPAGGEAAFAASGTCVAAGPDGSWAVATGGRVARLLRSEDRGRSWSALLLPVAQGSESAGAFSVAFRDARHAVVVGGDYRHPSRRDGTAAYSGDGGRTWTEAAAGPAGYRSCVAWLPGPVPACIAVGEGGTSVSSDGGRTWRELSADGFHAVACAPDGSVFATGAGGRIARLRAGGDRVGAEGAGREGGGMTRTGARR
jgi:photosystem II stability/assembly factor-like uncharacterized protein